MGACQSLELLGTTRILKSSETILWKTEDVEDLYTFDRNLGKGQFGITRLVIEKSTGDAYACKTISKRKIATKDEMEDVRREIQIMHHLSGHPNVVEFKGAYEDSEQIHIVMELCSGGELLDRVSERGYYRENDAARIMRVILEVVEHCHNMNVVHRDLKPENFLFSDETSEARLKAVDFGLSSFYNEGTAMTDLVGSPYYMAPEVIQRSYGKAADIWSCGVICFILLCGNPPFTGKNAHEIFQSIQHDALDFTRQPWRRISPEAKDCIQRMLAKEPHQRSSASEILRHEWLVDHGVAADEPLQPEILHRMRHFACMNKLKKEALKILASSLPPEEIVGIRQMFQDLDKDNSGTITVDELREGLKMRGAIVAEGELERLMGNLDLDGSNTLDYLEFLAATVNLGKLYRRENVMKAFQYFDKDGSGYITEDELKQVLGEAGSGVDFEAILSEVDRDSDHRIDYQEFCAMITSELTVKRPDMLRLRAGP